MRATGIAKVKTTAISVVASQINEAHRNAQGAAVKAMVVGIEHAIEVGRLLADAKAKCQHGEWIPWIEKNLEFNRKQAAAYMRAYECRKELSNVQPGKTFDHGLKGALRLLAKPRPKAKTEAERASRTRQDEELGRIVEEQTDAPDEEPDVTDEVDPENYRTAFVLRADQAVRFATDCGSLAKDMSVSEEMIDWARRTVEAWTALLTELENR